MTTGWAPVLSNARLAEVETEMLEAASTEFEPPATWWPAAERLFFGATFEEKAAEERRGAAMCRQVAREARAARIMRSEGHSRAG